MEFLNLFKSLVAKLSKSTISKPTDLKLLQAFILEPILTPSDLELPELQNEEEWNIPEPTVSLDYPNITFSNEASLTPNDNLFNDGIFTVGDTDKFSIDYLFDGGGYQGQLAIFNLEGMEEFDLNTETGLADFIHEAAHRALSNSDLGHVVIADVTGDANTFVLEDLRIDLETDQDYNDIIFQVRGATGTAINLDNAINTELDWRDYLGWEEGQDCIQFTHIESVNFHPDLPEVSVIHQPLIGIIDTGCSAYNPDIDYSDIILGHDYIDGDSNPLLSSGIENEHGTHIAGVIGAIQDNTVDIDGINDATPIWIGRAMGSGHWSDSLVEFVDAAKTSNQPNGVVNLNFDLTQINPDGSITNRTISLIWNANPALSYHQVIEILRSTALKISDGNKKFRLLNSSVAVQLAKTTIPDKNKFQIVQNLPTMKTQNLDGDWFDLVQEYCALAKIIYPSTSDQERLIEILKIAETDNRLNFWISQADELLEYELNLPEQSNELEQDQLIDLFKKLEANNYGFPREIPKQRRIRIKILIQN
jgi:hypothetical protein